LDLRTIDLYLCKKQYKNISFADVQQNQRETSCKQTQEDIENSIREVERVISSIEIQTGIGISRVNEVAQETFDRIQEEVEDETKKVREQKEVEKTLLERLQKSGEEYREFKQRNSAIVPE
jgi:uncharacterized protein (DUF4213/DUF364 family)